MPDQDQTLTSTRRSGELNEYQKRRLQISCRYIDKLLGDISDVLHAASSPSPFPRYVVDIGPAQIRVLEDYIRRFRTQLVRTIAWQDMQPEQPDIPATRAVMTTLAFVDIAAEELKPGYMRGYGAVPEDAIQELNGVVHELRSLVTDMERYLKQGVAGDLEQRLKRLEESGSDVGLLRLLEEIVTRNGLVEFRPRIDALIARMEDDRLEVALFGRVSSGKSSLLNALLGADVLPVGVNPITAVPTKLRYGPALKASISYGNGHSETVSIGDLRQLVTEQGNPGNLKNVLRVIVEVPSSRLKHGVLLVDTPGLGSLARRGAAETLAYLPSCDLALMLIDAGATLNEEDIGTLRLLYEGGIPALVLLSKADLLAEEDARRAADYIREQIKHDLGIDATVHPVSSLAQHSELLDRLFFQELLPRFEGARTLRGSSIARKIGALRESIAAALKTGMDRQERGVSLARKHPLELETTLRVVTGEIGEQRSILDRAFRGVGEAPGAVLGWVTQRAAESLHTSSDRRISSFQLSEWIHEAVAQSVEPIIEAFRNVGEDAIASLQTTAKELGQSDEPSQQDFELLLRDLPRFEMAAMPEDIRVSRWRLWVMSTLRSTIRSRLDRSIGAHLREELRLYGVALSEWSAQVVRKLEALVNSYADTYRVRLQRTAGLSGAIKDVSAMKKDLELLNQWKAGKSGSYAEERRA